MEITITGTPEEIKELFRTDEDSREQFLTIDKYVISQALSSTNHGTPSNNE